LRLRKLYSTILLTLSISFIPFSVFASLLNEYNSDDNKIYSITGSGLKEHSGIFYENIHLNSVDLNGVKQTYNIALPPTKLGSGTSIKGVRNGYLYYAISNTTGGPLSADGGSSKTTYKVYKEKLNGGNKEYLGDNIILDKDGYYVQDKTALYKKDFNGKIIKKLPPLTCNQSFLMATDDYMYVIEDNSYGYMGMSAKPILMRINLKNNSIYTITSLGDSERANFDYSINENGYLFYILGKSIYGFNKPIDELSVDEQPIQLKKDIFQKSKDKYESNLFAYGYLQCTDKYIYYTVTPTFYDINHQTFPWDYINYTPGEIRRMDIDGKNDINILTTKDKFGSKGGLNAFSLYKATNDYIIYSDYSGEGLSVYYPKTKKTVAIGRP